MARPTLAVQGTVWDSAGGTTLTVPAGTLDVVRISAIDDDNDQPAKPNFVALLADGTIAIWDTAGITMTYGSLTTNSTFVDLQCDDAACVALHADGTVQGIQNTAMGKAEVSGMAGALSNNTSGVAQVGLASWGWAVFNDGTATGWGTNPAGGSTFPTIQALVGVKSFSGVYGHWAAILSDGSVTAQVLMPSGGSSQPWFDPSNAKPPAGTGFTQVLCTLRMNVALKSDGTIAAWGYDSGSTTLPKVTKKVRALRGGPSSTQGVVLLMEDGTAIRYKPSGGAITVGTASGNFLDYYETDNVQIAFQSFSCMGIPADGCCLGNTYQYCASNGSVTSSSCATCSWSATAGALASGGASCSGSGAAPVGAPPLACCVPQCAGGKNCGDDGCGGVCGTCGPGKVCGSNQICACTLSCDDNQICTTDDCDATGCTHTNNSAPCTLGDQCSLNDACSNGKCASGGTKDCSDSDPCTIDACDSAKGCVHTAVNCDDGNSCTTDSCAADNSCVHTNTASACDDLDACTVSDTCSNGACAGTSKTCNDGNVCTADSCNPSSGCVFSPLTVACDDGDPCTVNDMCSAGKCVAGAEQSCNDSNPCTDDSCTAGTGCKFTPNTATCNAGNVCTTGDTCSGGTCQAGSSAGACDDGDTCTTDTCDPTNGCTFTAIADGSACDDGNVCTTGEQCALGKCKPLKPNPCDDGDLCTTDTCATVGACTHTPVAEGGACTDGSKCNTPGTCTSGKCTGFAAIQCDDGLPCTVDSCNPAIGCVHVASQGPCDDGDPCTTGDACVKGVCAHTGGCDVNAVCTLQNGAPQCVCKTGYGGDGLTCSVCAPSCTGKTCGPDGCGGTCGKCGGSTVCGANSQCVCQAACNGKTCGADGCGGSCGTCGSGQTCNYATGKCDAICVPTCSGKTCGPDGCGGACGSCSTGQFCSAGTGTCRWNVCPNTPSAGCCTGNTVVSCDATGIKAQDCNASTQYCDWDAAKGRYACTDTANGADPGGKNPRACSAVPACAPDCKGKACGPDGCGGACGTCAADQLCDFAAGICHKDPCTGIPAQGCCLAGDAVTCTKGKPDVATCNPAAGQCGWGGSAYACNNAGKSDPSGAAVKDCPASVCIPTCTGKNCGDDGCGGSCGGCPSGDECHNSVCCVPDCTGRNCGDDGCGGSCGSCASGMTCNAAVGHCMGTDQCQGAPFDVGCCDGETFKICKAPFSLQAEDCAAAGGRCGWDPKVARYSCKSLGGADPNGKPQACPGSPACVPACAGKSCGPDGCGGTCPNTCNSGENCTSSGTCTAACGNLAAVGCCDGGKAVHCSNVATAGGWQISSIDCQAKGLSCGYTPGHVYACLNGKGTAAPGDNPPMSCPASAFSCQPDCAGKACGPDGCGGTCGQCQSFETCEAWSGTCYVPPPDCKGNSWAGTCNGSVLSFCSASSQLISTDCGKPVEPHNGTTLNMCAWNDHAGAYGCEQYTDDGASTSYGSCQNSFNNAYSDICGSVDSFHHCGCDMDCEARGDCCGDFASVCGQKVGMPRCGDGTCNTAYGEGCATCAADCQSLCVAASAGANNAPPWQAPFAPVLSMGGKPSQHAELVISPLDDPLPSRPPIPLEGLLAWMPERNDQMSAPGTHVTFGDLGTGGLQDAPGVLGPSLGLLNGTSPSGGVVRVTLETPLPSQTSYSTGKMGGMSLAMWVKVPTGAPDVPQPIAGIFGGGSEVAELCDWSRPQDAAVTVTCPTSLGAPNKIIGIYAYYGEINQALQPQWNAYFQSLYAPRGWCGYLLAEGATHKCEYEQIQPWLEAQCLGKSSCHIDPWSVVKDPCTTPTDPNIKSGLQVRALCAPSMPPANAYLVVGDNAAGHVLRFEAPGLPALTGKSDLKTGTWHHVALVYRPLIGGNQAGVAVLYVDGVAEASSETLVPPSFSHLWLGAAVLAGDQSGSPNLIGNASAAVADLDDAFLYDRALSDHEVRALRDKATLHVARVWPPAAAEAAIARPHWTTGPSAQLQAIESQKLLGPDDTTKGQSGEKLAAPYRGVHVPAGTVFHPTVSTAGLSKLEQFALAAWIRVPALPSDGSPVLRLLEGDAVQVTVAGSAACGQRALTATVGNGPATQVQACEHGLAADEWAFVTVVRAGTVLSLRIDGHEIGVGTASGAILPGAATATTIEFTGEIDVAWASLFDSALSYDELQRWRGQGPAVWSDAATWVDDKGQTHLRDYADFHNNSDADLSVRQLTPWTIGGPLVAQPPNNGPLVLAANQSAGILAVTVPALGRIGHPTGSPARPFTWSAHLSGPLPSTGKAWTVPLVQAWAADGSRLVAARMLCENPTTQMGKTSTSCHLELVRDGTGAGSQASAKFALQWPPGEIPMGFDVDLALAWDGFAATAAVGARGTGSGGSNWPVPATMLNFSDLSVTWPTEPTVWPQGTPVVAMTAPAPDGPTSLQLEELRLYARVLSALELQQLVDRSCATVECGAQDCVQFTAADVPMCGPCDATHYEAGDQMGDSCLPRRPFYSLCNASEQCTSGLCISGRCQAYSQTDECNNACGALKRSCVVHEPVQFGAAVSVYGCSAECVQYYQPPTVDSDGGHCVWAPTVADDDACTSDDACISGLCRVNDTPTFDGGTQGGKVCAFASAGACKSRFHRSAVAIQTGSMTGQTVYKCGGCDDEVFNGAPLWHESYTLMTPAACETGSTGATSTDSSGTKTWEYCFDHGNVSLACLATIMLGITGAPGSSDIAKLRTDGIGPMLINAMQNNSFPGGKQLPFCYCGKCPSETNTANAFHNAAYNYPICVGNQFPNGTTCPPPGVTVAAGEESSFCESGYCARDTHQCEIGVTRVEDTRNADRNDAQESKHSSDYGPLTMTQTNRATLEVRKAPGSAASAQAAAKRTYSLGASASHSASIFGSGAVELVSLDMSVNGKMDDKEASYVPHLFLFGLEQPKVTSLVPPSSCNGNNWVDGELQSTENCSVAMDTATLTPTVPTATICPPVFKGCEPVEGVPNWAAGPTCIKRTTFVGPVPVSVEASAFMDVCVEIGVAIDSDTFEPAFKAGPTVDIGVEVKGGAGVDEGITLFAGVKASLSLLKLGFPITWALKVEQVLDSNNTMVEGMFKVKYSREISAEMTILQLTLSLFAEAGLGWFKVEMEYPLFDEPGVSTSRSLGSAAVNEVKIDLNNPVANQ